MNRIAFAASDGDELSPEAGQLKGSGDLPPIENDKAERYSWLEAMVDHIPDFIYAKDLQGRFLFANKALVKNNGLTDIRDLIGKTDFHFLPAEAAQIVTDIEHRVATTGEADLGFDELAELGDKNRWLMMSRVPLRNAGGDIIGVVGASRDITLRKGAERLMKAQAHLLGIIARGTPLPVFLEDLTRTLAGLKDGLFPAVLLVSQHGRQLSLSASDGLSAEYRRLADAAALRLGGPETTDADANAAILSEIFDQVQLPGQPYSCRCIAIPGTDGQMEGLLALHMPDRLDMSEWSEFLAIVVNMTGIAIARHRAETRIGYLAEHDALTGLANRSLFDRQLTEAVATAKAQKTEMALAFLDLDDFKLVNDSLGHAAGDQLLKTVAERIALLTQGSGSVARIGGDEFVIILEEFDSTRCRDFLLKVREAVAAPIVLDGVEIKVTCSIGLASYPSHGATAAELLVSADIAMYRAKQMGRDCMEIFSAAMAASARRRLARTDELRRALARNGFCLHYQPQQDQRTGRIVGAEALIRWKHPTEGLVYPGDFIALAEETGLIVEIGEWVAREACRAGKTWQDRGLKSIRISINVSARQFQDKRLVETIAAAIADSGLEASWLELEVTESLIMRDVADSIERMKQLTALGVSLAVDDFGTGYSSLSVLKKFPLTRLKIDRSFITDIPDDQDDMAITSAIISLGQKLGLQVIAEGVETEEQARFLMESGCPEIQGYLFSRPIAEDKFRAMLEADGKRAAEPLPVDLA